MSSIIQKDILNLSVLSEQIDILDNLAINKMSLYDNKGFVELVDMMPRKVPNGRTADIAISRNARVSYAQSDKSEKDDEALVRYLLQNWHTSPFESVVFQFKIRLPIFVERQLIRHRTARVNEQSFRYIVPKEEIYSPKLRMQSKNNKQGSSEEKPSDNVEALYNEMELDAHVTFSKYNELVNSGVAREVARCYLPVNVMTEMMWQMDLHNLLHFLQLRLDPHAQKEIRDLAAAILAIIKPLVPITIKAFEDFRLGLVSFNIEEQMYLKNPKLIQINQHKLNVLNKKLKQLGIIDITPEV
jgi:thymidylate synthase (FAD)